MKDKLTKEFTVRSGKFPKTDSNSKNNLTTSNTLAIPVLVYSFGIVRWLRKGIEKINRKTGKLLTMEGIHHPKADFDRLCIIRRRVRRGGVEMETACSVAVVGLSEYIKQVKIGLPD